MGLGNFGFRIHYNKIFAPAYLPSRVRYNQAFFWLFALCGAKFATSKTNVSCLCYFIYLFSFPAMSMKNAISKIANTSQSHVLS